MRWGHSSLFHAATSLLSWYKIFCMGDILYKLIWMKFINILSMYVQSGMQMHFNWWIIEVLTQNPSVMMSEEICRNMGICCGFRTVATREKYLGSILFSNALKWLLSWVLLPVTWTNVDWDLWHHMASQVHKCTWYSGWELLCQKHV